VAFVTSNHATLRRDFQDLLDLCAAVKATLPELASTAPAIHEHLAATIEAADLDYLARAVPKKIADNLDGLERVKRIVLDLRSFSRLDEGDLKPCDLAEGITATIRFLSPLLAEHQVHLETEFAPLPPLVCAPGQLNQAISNVVANAIQASRPGQTVTITTLAQDQRCLIRVTDTGEGIAPEILPRVFDPFFTTRAVGSGTGLGMHIAHQVITAHHGEIKISSQPGQGTTVTLEVPLHASPEPAVRAR
jgi:signal transduction histidine kinase